MSTKTEFRYPSSDGITQIRAVTWVPDEGIKPTGLLQIVHGMQEFIDRYDAFATFMTEHGYIVFGNDMLGHGGSLRNGDERYWGYFGRGLAPGDNGSGVSQVASEAGTEKESDTAEAGTEKESDTAEAGTDKESDTAEARDEDASTIRGTAMKTAYSGTPLQDVKTGGHRFLVQDVRNLQNIMIDKYPGLPCYMLGHSMGSFLAREFLCLHGRSLEGAVISGTAYHPPFETALGKLIATIQGQTKGWFFRSPLLNKLSVGNLNKEFQPERTPCDWLTRDESIVDKYVADKRTQFKFTCNAYYALFDCLGYLTKAENLRHMPKDLPVLLIAGEQDPVGADGDGPKRVAAQLQRIGCRKVAVKLYPQDRHEVLNELNRQEVWNDVRTFLEKAAPAEE